MKPTAIIVDIDGTLAHMHGRSPYDPTKYHTDTVDEVIKEIVNLYNQSIDVIVVSGRDDIYQEVTEKWLQDNDIHYSYIYMRKAGDKRNDAVIKRELYEQHIKPQYEIRFVLDDRNRVVEMWRSEGLKVLQVAEGDF
jgi:uncharacterized HAD superfamily protein